LDLPHAPEVRRILVMKWSALGDVALASAAFEDIRGAFPRAALDLNILRPWDRLFAHDPRFERVLAPEVRDRGHPLRGTLSWLAQVRRGRYDLIIDLQSSDHSRLLLVLLWLTGGAPRYRIGHHRVFPYNIAPAPAAKPRHALDLMRAALAAGGIEARAPRPVLHVPPRNRGRVQRLLAEHGVAQGRYAVFLPGCQARGYLKRWGARRYVALGLELRELGIPHVLLLGAADEAEECREIRRCCGDFVVDLCGRTEVLDLPPLCEGARFVVANDTGTAHVGAAAGRPMVVVCGPTDPCRVRPAGPSVRALQAPIYCAGCYRKDCSHHSCMMLVSPGQVIAELRRLRALDG